MDTIVEDFWKKWVECYAPTTVKQNKWHSENSRELKVGDVVVVADRNALRGQYFIAKVCETFPGIDGRVGSTVKDCKGCKEAVMIRAVQKLALLVPVD